MLSEIITIPNSGDMVSGTGRPQSLKDGVFGGPGQSTDHSDSGQKNFLSVLSLFGLGTVQAPPEESSKLNLKPPESQSADEAATNDTVSGKIKEKPGKGSQVSKRLTSVYPKSPGFVMGLLSIPDPQHPDLSVKTDSHSLDLGNETNSSSDLIAGGSPPEIAVTDRLPDEKDIQTSNPLAATGLFFGSDGIQVQAQELPKLREQQHVVQSQASLKLGEQGEQRYEATPGPVPLEAGLSQTGQAGADLAQVVQGRGLPVYPEQRQPDLKSVSGPVFSGLAFSGSDGVPAVQVQELPKLREQQHVVQ